MLALRGEQLAPRVEHREEVLQAAGVALAREFFRASVGRERLLELADAFVRTQPSRERGLRVAQRFQTRAW